MSKPLVMVVDDNLITIKLMKRYLNAAGYEVASAEDGLDCLQKLEEIRPDVIVMDVMMPKMDGYQATQKIKENEKTKDIPVVIVTALNDVSNQLKSIVSGADDFLSKPIEEKLLLAKVKVLANLSRYRDALKSAGIVIPE